MSGTPQNNQPTVCCVMLTKDRPELARRAVECLRAQTYKSKQLLVYDTGPEKNELVGDITIYDSGERGKTIGELRNYAVANAVGNGVWHLGQPEGVFILPDILIHWDDDDYSHPSRIAEQVALLQSSGADVVGYREMLFWRERSESKSGDIYPGQAWLYSNGNPGYCLGTSLCYWRRVWEARPFEPVNQGEDLKFCTGLKCASITSLAEPVNYFDNAPLIGMTEYCGLAKTTEPRMIARIHSGNTSGAYNPKLMAKVERDGGEWSRVPQWDKYCAEVMGC